MLLERDKEVEEEDEEEGDKDGEQDKIRRQATLLSRKGKGAFRESSYLRVLNKTLQQNTKVGFAHKFKFYFFYIFEQFARFPRSRSAHWSTGPTEESCHTSTTGFFHTKNYNLFAQIIFLKTFFFFQI